ncbi:MAG: aldo/keto reductase [Lachnospiraceae bacterium]|nr:aldo/keto reductase [Lachnospiraceae bacterium]
MKKLGFGAMRLPITDPNDKKSIDYPQFSRMIDTFLERGFTYFDTAYPYHEEMSEIAIRECLVKRHPRDSFLLADKMPIIRIYDGAEYPKYFEEQLKKTGVDYFDYYLLHNMGVDRYERTCRQGAFEFVAKKKEEGFIGKIGVSFHDRPALLEDMLTKYGDIIDFIQIQLNYLDWESPVIASHKNYDLCVKYGKPVVVMEPVKGGTLVNKLPQAALDVFKTAAPDLSPASWAIRYAASLPNVMTVLSGMSTIGQLLDNTSYMQDFKPLSEEEQQVINEARSIIERAIEIPCTACGYCMEQCPMNINIPAYFDLYNQYCTGGGKSSQYYERSRKDHGQAKDCLHCGLCEDICPQHIAIRDYLEKFAEVYKDLEEKFS